MAKKNEALLRRIRDRYAYLRDCWREARDERAVDMRYIDGDPWEEEDRRAREDAGRPCINHDELGQYVIAAVNGIRQNPRGIKFEPRGAGSNDKTAETRQGLVRTIEYRSHAASIYATAYQQMVEGSYGFFRVSRKYVADDSFEQHICIAPIANPDSVLFDWDAKEPDWSDAKDCFVLDPLPRDEFEQRWPNAEIADFTAEDLRVASDWIDQTQVLVAEYWAVETEPATLYELADGSTSFDAPEGAKTKRSRQVRRKSLVQYLTNGVEILETNPQPGTAIPIVPMIGLQRYFAEHGKDRGGTSKRKIYSLIRLARDPQMSHAYLCSQEMEEAGLTPKTPYVGYAGQFETDAEAWDTANKIPHSYLQADPIVDGATGAVLPLPRRESFTPNFSQYEVAKESARRAIQAAVGISPLPTPMQRDNQKSGVALERIQGQMETGSFHFVDSYERALEYAGRVVDSWIPATYDTEREEALRKPDDSQQVVKLNTEQPYRNPQTGAEEHFPVGEGDHDITISTAPSMRSQREAADDFLDNLISNLGNLPVAPPQRAKLLSLAIRMKQLGPKGDEMADIISPPDAQLPPQAQQALQQAHGMIQQLTGALNKMSRKLEAKLPEIASKERIALIGAKAGIIEAAIKDSSTAALATFQADIDQIDRVLALMPDPGMEEQQDVQPQPGGAQQPQPLAA